MKMISKSAVDERRFTMGFGIILLFHDILFLLDLDLKMNELRRQVRSHSVFHLTTRGGPQLSQARPSARCVARMQNAGPYLGARTR